MSVTNRLSLRHVRTRPLAVVASGLVLVALDFRTRSVDVLPDVIGWLLVGAGGWMAAVPRVLPLSSAAAGLSLAELSLPYHFVRYDPWSDTFTRVDSPPAGVAVLQRWDDLSQLRGAVIASAMALGAAAVVVLLRSLAERAHTGTDDTGVHELRVAMVAPAIWSLVFAAVIAAAVVSSEPYDPMWDGVGEAAWLVSVVALLGLAVFLTLRRDRAWGFVPRSQTDTYSRGAAPSRR